MHSSPATAVHSQSGGFFFAYNLIFSGILTAASVEISSMPLYNLARAVAHHDVDIGEGSPWREPGAPGWRSTTYLDLSHIRFAELPETVYTLNKLKALNLGGNPISTLSPRIARLEDLKVLILSGTNFRELPQELEQLQALEVLEVDDACLEVFPSFVTKMPNLRVLSLARNSMKSVDAIWGETNSLTEVDLSGNLLSAFPDGLLQLRKLEALRISENDIVDVPRRLAALENLKVLDVSYNPISNILPVALPTDLQSLFAYGCPITDVADDPALSRLQEEKKLHIFAWFMGDQIVPDDFDREYHPIDLRDFPATALIQHVPESVVSLAAGEDSKPGQLAGLHELRSLSLSRTSWHPQLDSEQFRHLRVLSMSILKFHGNSFPKGIKSLNRLVVLSLRQCGLTVLPEDIGELRALRALDLSENMIQELPDNFGNLVRLDELIMTGGKLRRLPSSMESLTMLRYMDLGMNKITSVPPGIGGLKQLETLDVSDNQLTALPEEFSELRNLRDCNLANNRISHLPDNISLLKSIEVLNMMGNPVPLAEQERIQRALPDTAVLCFGE